MKNIQTSIRIPTTNKNALLKAEKCIREGGVIVYPTDTVYGFGVDATSKTAITKLNKIKNRTGPFSIIVCDLTMAFSLTSLSHKQKNILRKNLKGATTIIVPLNPGHVHLLVAGKDNSIGLRIPNHKFGTALVQNLGIPITTTSVNRHGYPAINNPEEIIKSFGNSIDLLIDEGTLPSSKGSKILEMKEEELEIIRE